MRKFGLPEGVLVARLEPGQRSVGLIDALASDALLIISLAAVYAFLQYSIPADWPAYIFAPLSVLLYRLAVLKAESRGANLHWLRNAAATFVPFAVIYTPLQWAIAADWPAWVITPLILLAGWTIFGLIEVFEDQ